MDSRSKRSRHGCLTCRRRRIKCDERARPCTNCSRIDADCIWEEKRDRKQRSRSNKACSQCRLRRIKCLASVDAATCQSCVEQDLICSNEALPADGEDIVSSDLERSKDVRPFLERSTLRKLIECYFNGPYHFCFYSFLHAPTLMQMFDTDRVPQALLLIIAATALRILDLEDPRPHRWADECRRIVLLDAFTPPTQTTLQTFILLQRYEWHRGSHMSAWITSSIAVRLTHALQLNLELPRRGDHAVSETVQEMRRRTLWACFVMESLMEGGCRPFSGLDLSSIETFLPCDEQSFQLGEEREGTLDIPGQSHSGRSELPDLQGRPDIPAYLVRLAVLRLLILQYTAPYHPRNMRRIPEVLPWHPAARMHQFEAELSRWSSAFPETMRFSTDNLYRRQPAVLGFVTFHCMFHGCYCDLYRIGSHITANLSRHPEDSPFSGSPESFLRRCKVSRFEHAMNIARIIDASLPHLQCEHDPFIAISACLAIRILVVESGSEWITAREQSHVHGLLQSCIRCAKQTARWSVPIRKLLIALSRQAQQADFLDFDLSDLQPTSDAVASSATQTRPASPSLNTYGTFGSIQSTLTKENDAFTPVISPEELPAERSDAFATPIATTTAPSASLLETRIDSAAAVPPVHMQAPVPVQEPTFEQSTTLGLVDSSSDKWFGWNISSNMPGGGWDSSLPYGWADHSLGFDPEHDWGLGLL